jgi:hypothetical protein
MEKKFKEISAKPVKSKTLKDKDKKIYIKVRSALSQCNKTFFHSQSLVSIVAIY